MENRRNLLKILFFSWLAGCGACSAASYEYVNEDSRIHNEIEIPAGPATASLEFSVGANNALPLIESDYPVISVFYGSKANVAGKLKKLEVRLLVDGKEITADETAYQATHFGKTITLTEAECCEKLDGKLEIGSSKPDTDYPFGVHIIKKYKSLKFLPPEVTVVISTTTDKGTVETVKKLSLKAYKDSNFIRVH